MKFNLPERVFNDLIKFAEKHSLNKIILFGSRAKNIHDLKSDIDIAVTGGDFDAFYFDVNENIHSLLMFDIVNLNSITSQELNDEIKNYGVTIYEKA